MQPCDLPATDARDRIAAKRLSPVELLDSCIARIEAVDRAVNAIPARDFDRARQAARAAEDAVMRGAALGPLHGLPVAIKDLVETEGLVTSYGSTLYRTHLPKADEGVVTRLKRAGAIVLGKSNVPEFGAGANTRNRVYGATGNPFDPRYSCAGSSGGAAVALATGMVPIAQGGDTGGSLRNPAAWSGVVALRPSPGLVPSEKREAGWNILNVQGPMARSVADTALMLAGMAGEDSRDPLCPVRAGEVVLDPMRFAVLEPLLLSTLRVAFTADLGFAPTSQAMRAVFEQRVAALAPAFGVAEMAHPDMTGADEAFAVLRAAGYATRRADMLRDHPEEVGPNIAANVAEGRTYSLADLARAQAMQTRIYRAAQSFFARFDLLVLPAMTIGPTPWRELFPTSIDGVPTRSYFHWLALAYGITLIGHPALCIPCGRDAAGFPFGLQVVGPRGGDALVLQAGLALEQLLAADATLRRPVPDLEALVAAPPIAGMEGFRAFD